MIRHITSNRGKAFLYRNCGERVFEKRDKELRDEEKGGRER